ncbi:MAG TPA: MFS transporter [Phototrophicaceae bacterium]|nr:MFS transporter [Phototrophicaceae bacterium]
MSSQVLTNAEKIRRLPWNTAMNAANSIFANLTFFGPVFVLFLSELNLSNTEIGFLLSLLPFTGLIAVVVAPAVARYGYKRTFVIFWALRKIITAGLLFVPWILAEYGSPAALVYVTVIVAGFSICRAISETGMYPWAQEFIPNSIRGRYTAITDIVSRLTGIAAIGFASYVLGLAGGLDRFMLLFGVAFVFSLIALWSATHIPGGAPVGKNQAQKTSYGHLLRVLKDKNFLLFVAGIGVLTIGTTPMGSFLPLFMEKQIGLTESMTVLLTIGAIGGGLAATYLMGWAADRYGSKPVMLSGLYIKALLPLGWLLMPRSPELGLPVALLIAIVNGVADIAWALGSARLLYVRVVPSEKKAEYMAVYYAAVGLIGGLSQVGGGRILDFTSGLSGQFLIFTIDPFFPLFVFGIVLTFLSILLFRHVQADSPVGVSEFAGLFIHGNPVTALESMFRYYRARDERATVAMTERMGHTKSPLTVDELLEALKDPRFNVRFEAVISIARMDSDPRLVTALCQILDGTELSLSVIAAWALGRIGDEQAIVSLRHGLDSPYRSIQAHCIRALGTLGDTEIAPRLLEQLQSETDKGLRIAYASALGNLHAEAAIPTLLAVLKNTENEGARLELALALARIVGDEQHFIRLLRQIRQEKGTSISQALNVIQRRLELEVPEIRAVLQTCEDTFAREDLTSGVKLLSDLLRGLPPETHTSGGQTILAECAARLDECGATQIEYILLALHTLEVAAT